MREFQVEWRNFRSFERTGPLPIRPITIIIGSNNSGKTSLLAPLLLLKQTLASPAQSTGLLTNGPMTNVGSFRDIVFQHRDDRAVSLSITWAPEEGKVSAGGSTLGSLPPGRLLCEFASSAGVDNPILASYEVQDIAGRVLMRRERRDDGSYSIDLRPATWREPSEDHDGQVRAGLEEARPRHFLFAADDLLLASLRHTDVEESDQKTEEPEDAKAGRPVRTRTATLTFSLEGMPAELSGDIQYYGSIVATSQYVVQGILTGLHYIGPLRERPQRIYELSGEMPADVGTRGEFAPEIIYRWQDEPERLKELQRWLLHFGFTERLEAEPQGEYAFSLRLRRNKASEPTALVDLGFGTSQVLPLIVQGILAPKDRVIVAEQPEIHLNPALQAKLADLFVSFVNEKRLGVVVETHSEHLLLRLRRLVAERRIDNRDVAIYFVDRVRGRSKVRRVEMDDMGQIDSWPHGFFEEALHESVGLAEAQVARLSTSSR